MPALPETPASRASDLWILGDHKLLVGDATNRDDVAKLMAGDAADLIFTDPPYNCGYEGYTKDKLHDSERRHGPRSNLTGSSETALQDPFEPW